MTKKVDMDYKVIILGMSEVGKTCLLVHYFDNKFQDANISTIGIDFKTKYFKFKEKKVKVNYVDTAGQERFHSIASNFLKNANGILLVYAINSRASFDKLQEWLDELNKFTSKLPIIIVGNKSDLESEREVSRDEGENFAKKINCKFYEVSAKNGYNVTTVFDEIAKVTFEYLIDKEEDESKKNTIQFGKENEKKRCCN